jgi:hypothetical protein
MAHDRLVFYLGENPVGRFCGRGYPTYAGRIKYSPYRGTGHMHMATTLRRGEVAKCWFARRGKRVTFDVVREELVLGSPRSQSNWYLEVSRLENPSTASGRTRVAPSRNTIR